MTLASSFLLPEIREFCIFKPHCCDRDCESSSCALRRIRRKASSHDWLAVELDFANGVSTAPFGHGLVPRSYFLSMIGIFRQTQPR